MNFMEAFNRLTETYDDAIEPFSGFLWFLETANSDSILGLLDAPQSNSPDFEAHLFITPNGAVINVDSYNTLMQKYFSDSAIENGYTHNMHSDFIKLLWCLYLAKDNKTIEEIQEIIADEDLADILDTAFIALVSKHGWVRYTFDLEDRDYPFIQCPASKKLTAAQYDVIQQLLVETELKKLPFYVEFLDEYGQPVAKKTYKLVDKLAPLFAEDIIKRIAGFYTTGRLNENNNLK